MTPTTLLTRTKQLVRQNAAHADALDDDRIQAMLDDAAGEVGDQLREIAPDLFVAEAVLTLSNGEASLPADFAQLRRAWIGNMELRGIDYGQRHHQVGVWLSRDKVGYGSGGGVGITGSEPRIRIEYLKEVPPIDFDEPDDDEALVLLPDETHLTVGLTAAVMLRGTEAADPVSGQMLGALLAKAQQRMRRKYRNRRNQRRRSNYSLYGFRR